MAIVNKYVIRDSQRLHVSSMKVIIYYLFSILGYLRIATRQKRNLKYIVWSKLNTQMFKTVTIYPFIFTKFSLPAILPSWSGVMLFFPEQRENRHAPLTKYLICLCFESKAKNYGFVKYQKLWVLF